MNKRHVFLMTFSAFLTLIFVSLYLVEDTILVFVREMIIRLSEPQPFVADIVTVAWTTVYVALCGFALPTPAELPLILSARVGLVMIVVASAIGKSIGATILFIFCSSGLKFGNHDARELQRSLRNLRVGRIFQRNRLGFIYTLCQAIPFAPMRSATVAYSVLSPLTWKSLAVVAIGSFFGTVSRMLIIAGIAFAGFSLLT
jgi:hypothetical protein